MWEGKQATLEQFERNWNDEYGIFLKMISQLWFFIIKMDWSWAGLRPRSDKKRRMRLTIRCIHSKHRKMQCDRSHGDTSKVANNCWSYGCTMHMHRRASTTDKKLRFMVIRWRAYTIEVRSVWAPQASCLQKCNHDPHMNLY